MFFVYGVGSIYAQTYERTLSSKEVLGSAHIKTLLNIWFPQVYLVVSGLAFHPQEIGN